MLRSVYGDLERQGREALAGTSVQPRHIDIKRAADMRYVGQEHAVTVDLPLRLFEQRDRVAIKRVFDSMHALRYGTSAPGEPAEIVSLRSTVTGSLRKPRPQKIKRANGTRGRSTMTGRRAVYFNGAFRSTPAYDRAALVAGQRIRGPALIEEHASTTVLLPGDRLEVDAYGNLLIEIAGGRLQARGRRRRAR